MEPITFAHLPFAPKCSGVQDLGREQSMEPMKPMRPMEPMARPERWWPDHLGEPSTSGGGQNEVRYAFFPDKHRLLIEQDGALSAYDSADYRITGVSQQQSQTKTLAFATREGSVDLSQLKKV
jgi:hypothetical protein